MNRMIVVLVLAAIAGNAVAQVQKEDPIISSAKAAIAAKLKDPESARFQNVVYVPSQKGTGGTVCGEVNAKNSFGGYVGFTPFMVIGESAILRDKDIAVAFDPIFARSCSGANAQESGKAHTPQSTESAHQYRCTDEKGQPYITVTADPPAGCVVQ